MIESLVGLPLLTVAGLFLVVGAGAQEALRQRAVARARGRLGPGPSARAWAGEPSWWASIVVASGLRISSDRAWAWARGPLVVLVGWGAVRSPVVVLLLGGIVAAGSIGHRRRGPGVAYDTDAVGVLDGLAAVLSAGGSLRQAVVAVANRPSRCSQDLVRVVRHLEAGGALGAGLDAWAARRPGTVVPLVVDALAIAETSGASPVAAVGHAAGTARVRLARAREVRALASQARASAAVLIALPVVFVVVVAAADRRVASFLVSTGSGWACLLGGLALDAVGAWWMVKMMAAVR